MIVVILFLFIILAVYISYLWLRASANVKLNSMLAYRMRNSHRRVIIELRSHYDFYCLCMFWVYSMSTNACIEIKYLRIRIARNNISKCIHDTWCLFHVRLYRAWSVRRSSFHMKKNQTNFFRIEWLYLFIWLLMEFDPQSTYGWADGLRLTVTLHVESVNCACRCAECIGSTWIFSHVFEHMWNSIDLIGISAGR